MTSDAANPEIILQSLSTSVIHFGALCFSLQKQHSSTLVFSSHSFQPTSTDPAGFDFTVERNIIILNVGNSGVAALLKEPHQRDRFSPEPPLLVAGLVACTAKSVLRASYQREESTGSEGDRGGARSVPMALDGMPKELRAFSGG
ncbi:hypothetical protein Nepgr_024953 [Nepenthes gracilis]|uniref:Uncharacterized protein n=1 Tax=Nepenthes gracilis TaxID=150966 RepID=A0AAD3T4Y6_NEPGR|nr:hypothetical protein Nepgr_024953 [Nepenthes gracilis]